MRWGGGRQVGGGRWRQVEAGGGRWEDDEGSPREKRR